MVPFLRFGPILVPTFGLMIAAAMVVAYFVLRADMARRGLAAKDTTTAEMFVAVPALVGIVGAKIYHVLETPSELFADPLGQLFSRYGLAWFGGFIAGFVGVCVLARRNKLPLLEIFDAGSAAAAIGYGLGRIGCLVSGDGDYGIPTSLPWGMSFPHGLVPTDERVHPTPIYELIVRVRDRVDPVAAGHAAVEGAARERFAAAGKRVRGVPDSDGRRAISGGVHSHQSAIVPRNVECAGGERGVGDSGRGALVACREEIADEGSGFLGARHAQFESVCARLQHVPASRRTPHARRWATSSQGYLPGTACRAPTAEQRNRPKWLGVAKVACRAQHATPLRGKTRASRFHIARRFTGGN